MPKTSEEEKLNNLSQKQFIDLYDDLIHRKNDYRHGGKRPATMIEYLAKMKQVAKERNINLPADPQG